MTGAILSTATTDKKKEIEQLFGDKITQLQRLKKALGSQDIGCSHTHHGPHNHSDPCYSHHDEENPDAYPKYPTLELEEPEDWAVLLGKVGEMITSVGGALAIGPLLDLLLNWISPNLSESSWFKPNPEMETSLGSLLISLILVIPAIYGGPACHATLEIASRTRNNLLILAKYRQKVLQWGLKNGLDINDPQLTIPSIKIGDKEIPIDEFKLIYPSEATSLTFQQNMQIAGDAQQHLNEYVGLSIIAILRNIKNPIARAILIPFILIIQGKACGPEVTTCFHTLKLMNTLENKHVIDDPKASNEANCDTKFSAIAKIPAVFYANLLSFVAICRMLPAGGLPVGIALALLATIGNVVTQFCINANTQTIGASQQSEHEHTEVAIDDKRTPWEQLSPLGKAVCLFSTFGASNERSEPITIALIVLMASAGKDLSIEWQAIAALSLFLAILPSTLSQTRNAVDHTARFSFFTNKPKQLLFANPTTTRPAANNGNGLKDPLLNQNEIAANEDNHELSHHSSNTVLSVIKGPGGAWEE